MGLAHDQTVLGLAWLVILATVIGQVVGGNRDAVGLLGLAVILAVYGDYLIRVR